MNNERNNNCKQYIGTIITFDIDNSEEIFAYLDCKDEAGFLMKFLNLISTIVLKRSKCNSTIDKSLECHMKETGDEVVIILAEPYNENMEKNKKNIYDKFETLYKKVYP